MFLAKWLRSLRLGGCPDGRRVRPQLERLEERNLLHAGHAINISLDAILYTPLTDVQVVQHIHPHLSIVIDGQDQLIPADIGILGAAGNMPLHTHDGSGTLHVESMVTHEFQLQDFFSIWGQTFNSQEILGHHADALHPITMTVDGQPSTLYGAVPLTAFEQIVITLNGVP